jgi:hypothetical protein
MFCPNCGKRIDGEPQFCPECGANLAQNAQPGAGQTYQNVDYNRDTNSYVVNTYRPKFRSIAMCIILSIVTCGIYGIYWIYVLNEDVNGIQGKKDPSGLMVILLSIVTCGIYEFIWMYNVGTGIDKVKANGGAGSGNSGLVYLLLSIFGLGIVAMALAQNELNQMSGQQA